jgi:hypothetical protein
VPRQSTKVERTCQQCHKIFFVVPSAVKFGRGNYCSTACRDEARKIQIECICQQCKKKFRVDPNVVKRGSGKFCSNPCRGKSQELDMKETVKRHLGETTSTGCILWNGSVHANGYGMIKKDKRSPRRAHRVVWELTHGPIPDGLMVCHHCDNRRCVNLEHLFLGTHQDNMDDMIAKGRNAVGERCPQAKLTEEKVRLARKLHKAGTHTQQQIADLLGVQRAAIAKIVTYQRWKHID